MFTPVRDYPKIALLPTVSKKFKDMNGGPCVFDETFKLMARADGPVELSYAKSSVQEAARELGIDSSRITKWRQIHKRPSQSVMVGLSQEQKQIKRLQRELKDAQLERDILKKAVSIFSRSDRAADREKYSDL